MDFFGSFGDSEEQALELLTPVLDTALKAHETGDYELYRSVITDSLAEQVGAEQFQHAWEKIGRQMGPLLSKTFVASFPRDDNPMLLFAARYANVDEDVMINAIFRNDTQPPKLDWLWIE